MSSLKELGGCLWKLFQLGVVVAILVLGFMFIARPPKEKEETKEGEHSEARSNTGLVAKIRNLFGGEERKEGETAQGGMPSGDEAEKKLLKSQEDVGAGHVDLEKLLGLMDDENVKKEIELLAEGTTQIEQILFWQIIDGNVYYRIVLRPYDRKAHELMMQPGEALFMSFLSGHDQRLVPKSADHRIDMKYLRVATEEGYAAGWFFDGFLPMGGVDPETVGRGKVGWIFSNGLHARLRQIQAPRKPVASPVTEPFSSGIPVDDGGRSIGK